MLKSAHAKHFSRTRPWASVPPTPRPSSAAITPMHLQSLPEPTGFVKAPPPHPSQKGSSSRTAAIQPENHGPIDCSGTHLRSCTSRFALQVCPHSCIDCRTDVYSRLDTPPDSSTCCEKSTLLAHWAPLEWVNMLPTSLVLISHRRQDRVFRRDM